MPPITTKQTAWLDIRIVKFRVKQSFPSASKRLGTRIRARYIVLPQNLWDRIVLLLFTCCLLTFLHALFGFGAVDQNPRALNNTLPPPRERFSVSSPWKGGSNRYLEMRTRSMARVMVDWHGNYELLASTTLTLVPPASIPQDAFPDPTPAPVRAGRGPAPDEGSLSATTKVRTPVYTPFKFYGTPYDPFRLDFEDSVDGGKIHGLYLIAEPLRTAPPGARTRHFGRCPGGAACL